MTPPTVWAMKYDSTRVRYDPPDVAWPSPPLDDGAEAPPKPPKPAPLDVPEPTLPDVPEPTLPDVPEPRPPDVPEPDDAGFCAAPDEL